MGVEDSIWDNSPVQNQPRTEADGFSYPVSVDGINYRAQNKSTEAEGNYYSYPVQKQATTALRQFAGSTLMQENAPAKVAGPLPRRVFYPHVPDNSLSRSSSSAGKWLQYCGERCIDCKPSALPFRVFRVEQARETQVTAGQTLGKESWRVFKSQAREKPNVFKGYQGRSAGLRDQNQGWMAGVKDQGQGRVTNGNGYAQGWMTGLDQVQSRMTGLKEQGQGRMTAQKEQGQGRMTALKEQGQGRMTALKEQGQRRMTNLKEQGQGRMTELKELSHSRMTGLQDRGRVTCLNELGQGRTTSSEDYAQGWLAGLKVHGQERMNGMNGQGQGDQQRLTKYKVASSAVQEAAEERMIQAELDRKFAEIAELKARIR